MKKLAKLYITVVLLFVALFVVSNVLFNKIQKKNIDNTNILMNRIVDDLEVQYSLRTMSYDSVSPLSEKSVQLMIDAYMEENEKALTKEYGKSSIPDKVTFFLSDSQRSNVSLINKGDSSDNWICCI